MINKKLGLINIFLGILLTITTFIGAKIVTILNLSFIEITNIQIMFNLIGSIAYFSGIIIMLIINLISIFKNRKNKKNLILYSITLFTLIITFVLARIFKLSIIYLLFLNISILGVFILINKNEEKTKYNGKAILFGGIFNIILFIVSLLLFIILKSEINVKFTSNNSNLIKNIMQLSKTKSTEMPIMIKKDGKYGFINKDGKTIIEPIYDDGMEFTEITIRGKNDKYYFTLVTINNELRIITTDNKTVVSAKNNKIQEKISCIAKFPKVEDDIKNSAEKINLPINIELNEPKTITSVSAIKDYRYRLIMIENDGTFLDMSLTGNNDIWKNFTINTHTKEVFFNNKNVEFNGSIIIDNNTMEVFNNGYIPFYNFKNSIYGWIDLNGNVHSLSGNIRILDFIDDFILVKIFYNDGIEKICFIDKSGKIVSNFYKEISILDNGYIVKKENGRNVCIDKDFKEVTIEYDIIDSCRKDDGIIIVANLPDQITYTADNIPNNISYSIINLETLKIVKNNIDYINGMKIARYKKNNTYSLDEYIKLLTNVNSQFPNDKLYE